MTREGRLIGPVRRLLRRAEPVVPDQWAMAALDRLPILSLDLETTGLDVKHDRIVQIGALTGTGGSMDPRPALDSLVHPGGTIPAASTAIHGIGDDMVHGAPRIAALWPAIRACMRDRVVLGHQIGFDIAVLRAEAARHGLEWEEPPTLDLARLDAALHRSLHDFSLDGLAERLGVTIENRHSALGDAWAAARCWQAMLPLLAARHIRSFHDAKRLEARARRIIRLQRRAGWDALP